MPTPPVLLDAGVHPVVAARRLRPRPARARRPWLDSGSPTRSGARARLGELVPGRSTRRLDLAALERRLAVHGSDLLTLLAEAGCSPTGRREALDLDRDRDRRRARDDALPLRRGTRWGTSRGCRPGSARSGPGSRRRGRAAVVLVVARVLELADAPRTPSQPPGHWMHSRLGS